ANVSAQALIVTSAGDQTTVEGAGNAIPLGSFSDTTAGASSWTVDVSWGDGTPDTVFTTTSQGNLPNTPHTYGEEGTYTVTVTVTNNLNTTSSPNFNVTVSDQAVV